MQFTYFMPSKIFFGSGCLDKLGEIELPGKKALIITGGTSTTKLGYIARVQDLLAKNKIACELYDQVKPNPTTKNVADCAALIKKSGCDFVIGIGGGSSIDTAKAAALAAANPGDYWDYISSETGKGKKPLHDPLPVVAITTTAGTGTEADPWTVITKEETFEKVGFGTEKTFPAISFVDPDLMLTVPPRLTAYQGFDALFHAVEGYIAAIATPMSDLFALKSIELVGKSLAAAVRNGADKDARADVALANTLAGLVESTSSCTSEHSIEHALSAFHPHMEHGAGLIMISLEYHKHFLYACPDRYVAMARALGKAGASRPEDFIEALADLQKACGVDDLQLSAYGVDRSNLRKYAKNARLNMGGLFGFDRCELSEDGIIGLLERSYK